MLKNRLAARSFARSCSNAFRPTLTVPPRKKPTKEQVAFKNREQTIAATNALAAARPDSQEMLLRASHSTFAFDARRIEQVVTNLLTNAIRHGRASGVVRIETVDIELEGDRAIQVSVEDDGPGIPPEDRERLFAPYVRGVDTDAVRGLGIGLALCRRIVEAHAGRLHVEEGELSGARFVFGLPLDASRALGVAGEN